MNILHIRAEKLKILKPTASCCDCPKEVDEAYDEELWTIFIKDRIYCPECAENENIGPEK